MFKILQSIQKFITRQRRRIFSRELNNTSDTVDSWYLTTNVLPISDAPFQVIIHDICGDFRVSNAIFDKKTHENNREFPLIELQFPEWWEGVKMVSVGAWRPLPDIPDWIKLHCEQAEEEYWNELWERHMRHITKSRSE